MYRMEIKAENFIATELNVSIKGGMYDLREVSISPSIAPGDFNDNMFAEFEGENESGSGYEDIPSVLSSST